MSAKDKVKEAVAGLRRLTALRLLDEAGCPWNSAVIEAGLREFGVPGVGRDLVNADARWMAAAGLVTVEELRADLLVLTITARGERVSRGTERIEGVARPSED